ncbi:hypothetical protein CAN33_0038120 [Aspergillus niger]|uniref:Uncharacterized protein n=1 Tax=Aspergillus niger TaxID=5061 RepID=A0A505HUB6_ASPNG|nr:hypothetical protein CAN33_0038120 [Aspergillus niger]
MAAVVTGGSSDLSETMPSLPMVPTESIFWATGKSLSMAQPTYAPYHHTYRR